jgi:hypothetical protein
LAEDTVVDGSGKEGQQVNQNNPNKVEHEILYLTEKAGQMFRVGFWTG